MRGVFPEVHVDALRTITSVNCSCSEALVRVERSLSRWGLRALQTFDLQDARLGSTDCACPHHGTAQCDCQMLVLMVYGEATAPTTLMLHGNDGQTWISLSEDPRRGVDALIAAAIEDSAQDIQCRPGG